MMVWKLLSGNPVAVQSSTMSGGTSSSGSMSMKRIRGSALVRQMLRFPAVASSI
jgi:hypothetical protein